MSTTHARACSHLWFTKVFAEAGIFGMFPIKIQRYAMLLLLRVTMYLQTSDQPVEERQQLPGAHDDEDGHRKGDEDLGRFSSAASNNIRQHALTA